MHGCMFSVTECCAVTKMCVDPGRYVQDPGRKCDVFAESAVVCGPFCFVR